MGALKGGLQVLHTYADALAHANVYCKGDAKAEAILIRSIARAKGLPQRIGEPQAAKFFA